MVCMIDVTTESLVGLDQARKTLPGRRGRPVDLSTVMRWITKGVLSPNPQTDGQEGRVRLEAVRIGGRWCTSRQALQRFIERLTPAEVAGGGDRGDLPRTDARREQASKRAGRSLSESGI